LRKIVLVSSLVVAGGASWFAIDSIRAHRRTVEARDGHVARAEKLAQDPGTLSEAIVEYRAALGIDPDHVPALLACAELCVRKRLHDEAIGHLERVLTLASGAERGPALRALAAAHHERYRGGSEADFRAARDHLHELRMLPGFEAEALEMYGYLFLESGRNRDPVKALSTFEDLLSSHPDYRFAERIRELVGILRGESGGGP
jgi:tetratricopeptide (TPR) repeat protein